MPNEPKLETEELWLARDVARFTKLSERTVFTLTQDGTIPAVRLGRSVRYRPSAVMEALRKLESGVAQ